MNNSISIKIIHIITGMALFLSPGYLSGQPVRNSASTAVDADLKIKWPLPDLPGKANVSADNHQITLSNQLITASWTIQNNRLQLARFTDVKNKRTMNFTAFAEYEFTSALAGKVSSADFMIYSNPKVQILYPQANGPRVADHIPGKAVEVSLINPKSGMVVRWRAELRDGSNYIRQIYSISRPNQSVADTISEIAMLRLPVKYDSANSIGTVPGSPYSIPSTAIMAAIEQPGFLAKGFSGTADATTLYMPSQLLLGSGDHYQISTIVGVFPEQQRRRTFQYYLERERASPYRQYLHYNSWYDLGDNPTEEKLLKTAGEYRSALFQKRGIALDGFVLDDGWDNPDIDLWAPDPHKFTDGFTILQKFLDAAGGTKLGLWVSPYGGYGGQKERLSLAKKMGALPQYAANFDMGYPGYYKLYRQICTNFMKKYGINYFKWDNAAPFENNGLTFGNLLSTAHFMRLSQLAQELHTDNPQLFINATVGTWPSPFWLNFVDCTWRMGGADVSWIGEGNNRERGINYRDGEMYKMVVKRAPLYPISSMMLHGVVLGHFYQAKKTTEAGNNMTNEFRSYFAMGTNLQELYLSPDLMNEKAWDDLAACIRWSRKNAVILMDSHWVQGDPNKGEPYCFASWNNNRAVLCIRNPNDEAQNITLDINKAFELPPNAAKHYRLSSPYQDQRIQHLDATAGQPVSVVLQPFEVLVFDAILR